jgi:hypothetical protein
MGSGQIGQGKIPHQLAGLVRLLEGRAWNAAGGGSVR